jgi:hypothetical protein
MDKDKIEEQKKMMKKATETWRDVLEAYKDFKDKFGVFRTETALLHPDFAGPGLQVAMQMLFHKRNFAIFVDDLIHEDERHGGVSRLMPPKSSSGKKDKKPSFSEE